jgi:hypothetical protein
VNTPTRRKKKTNMSGDNTKLLEKKYKFTVDASDAGVDTVLLQEREDDINYFLAWFKFSYHGILIIPVIHFILALLQIIMFYVTCSCKLIIKTLHIILMHITLNLRELWKDFTRH